MTVRDLHGLAIRLVGDVPDAVPDVLTALPETTVEPALTVELASGPVAADLIKQIRELDAAFFHGKTNAFWRSTDTMVLTDGTSYVEVGIDGARIHAVVDPRSLEDGYIFAHATFFIAVMVALRSHGLFHTHAAAVQWRKRGVFIVGEGGAGKTTTTLALMADGAHWLGDDAVLLCDRDGPAALKIPKAFHIGDATASAFGDLEAGLGPAYRENHGKRAFDPTAVFDGEPLTSMPAPQAIVFPSIHDVDTTAIEAVSSAETMGQLAVSSAMLMIDGMPRVPEQIALLRQIANGAVGYELRLGRDVLRDPSVIPAALERTWR